LKYIKIDEQEGTPAAVPRAGSQGVAQAIEQHAPVWQARQLVEECEVPDFFFGCFRFGDIPRDRDQAGIPSITSRR